jgi:hypothetical protein
VNRLSSDALAFTEWHHDRGQSPREIRRINALIAYRLGGPNLDGSKNNM